MRIAIAGQSNGEGLASSFIAEYELLTKIKPEILDQHIGGAALKHDTLPHLSWLDGAGGHLDTLIKWGPQALWWIQGENEALNGPGDACDRDYAKQLHQFRALFSTSMTFMLSPIAGWNAAYKHTRMVLAVQYRVAMSPGFMLGPEYYDLPNDSTHLSGEGRAEFGRRGARTLLGIDVAIK